ncbi:MAG: FliM/FliN family flagellar motor switch protein [Phycisphaerales bacterium]|nr:FliM/FliN family flagellar motor switch protein [Phycisphaerales bacterium]
MDATLDRILKLRVPVIVRLGERRMSLGDVVRLVPGSIIELPKNAEEELELLVNNRVIGAGTAVKVAENFGLRLTRLGSPKARAVAATEPEPANDDDELAALAEAMLAGQI